MRFVIDETSWRFQGRTQEACIEVLEMLLDRLEIAHEEGHSCCYSELLFYAEVWENKTFYDLYDHHSGSISIPREVQERIAVQFGCLATWQSLDLLPPSSSEVQINGGMAKTAPSIAWAHAQTLADPANAIACLLLLNDGVTGSVDVVVDGDTTVLYLIENRQHYADFFRWLIVKTSKNPAEMAQFAPSAFPNVRFREGAFDGIKDMSKSYRELVELLTHHLAVFSDHGNAIFSNEGDHKEVAAKFGSKGVTISPENGNTRKNDTARKERTKTVDGKEIIFWWHSKLEPHQDRIHINPDGMKEGGKLLVGIFCRHLST